MQRLCTKTTHGSEWMINFNLLPPVQNYESHQRELVDRSFKTAKRPQLKNPPTDVDGIA